MVPVTVDGEPVKLAVITYKPAGAGPFPTLIFHHGSTGRGVDPTIFARPYDPKVLAEWFTARGWAVVLPSRRGRGGSEGTYDEGFAARSRRRAIPASSRFRSPAPTVPCATSTPSRRQSWPSPSSTASKVAVGGQSRGGILAIAWSGRQPGVPRAVVNFVGGWMGAGCSTASAINQNLFNRGAAYGQPTIWLYGDKDPFYPLSHSRANFAAFQAAGGKGAFHEYTPPEGLNGHQIGAAPQLWSATLDAYLASRGLPAKAP